MSNELHAKRLLDAARMILKEAASDEHDDIEERLAEYAHSTGYTKELARKLPSGKEPDVHRARLAADGAYIFIGDAKFSQGPSDETSVAQLTGYFEQFGMLLHSEWRLSDAPKLPINGGLLAVGSPSESVALGWSTVLNGIAKTVGLRLSGDSTEPSFGLKKLSAGKRTGCEVWMTYW